LSVHIRTLGDWTTALRTLFGKVINHLLDRPFEITHQITEKTYQKRFLGSQVCQAQVTSKKANLVRLETTVIADAEVEQTR